MWRPAAPENGWTSRDSGAPPLTSILSGPPIVGHEEPQTVAQRGRSPRLYAACTAATTPSDQSTRRLRGPESPASARAPAIAAS